MTVVLSLLAAALLLGGGFALFDAADHLVMQIGIGVILAALLVLGLATGLGFLALLPPLALAALAAREFQWMKDPHDRKGAGIVAGVAAAVAIAFIVVLGFSKVSPFLALTDISGVWKLFAAAVVLTMALSRFGMQAFLGETEAERKRSQAHAQRLRRRELQQKSKEAREQARQERRRSIEEKRRQ